MNFEVIPALDLKGGRCVQLVQGVKGSEIVSLSDPARMADHWISEGAKRLHIIDLDGAFQEKRRNLDVIEEIVKNSDVLVQVGGGIRSYRDAVQLLDIGVDRIILGTAAIRDRSLARKLADEFSIDRIMIALDTKAGEVQIEGWTEGSGLSPKEIARDYRDYTGSLLFTNIDVEGLLGGIHIGPIRDLVDSVDLTVVVAGGISHIEDIEKVRSTGADGVVIGTAIYKGNILLREAIERFE
ncbi:MAG: 1-(5-phosphoribosyl)-5-[(5-phosphoribosylamino)methylideneamino]imidazole-4-carboxamide isomerase [Halobacteriota archaeon]|nr:1-(5-phosphoribosyl)-5-[(5-phosphoribosylamino)methylideneamino]imidazole-4-carboxamide isomerase [Halobacteriota archaeon]